jgi:omega-6 fatty acid desaturase (delta-12 desaturase)
MRAELLPRQPSFRLGDGFQSHRHVPEDVRQGLRRYEEKSAPLALLLFTADAVLYSACFLLLASAPWTLALKLPFSILLGLLINRLFIVGHDAAHGSLTNSALLNAILARLAFLPSLHPCSLWQVGHNRVHHCFTNLKGIDFIWIPLSPGEYRNLSPLRRTQERFYRSIPGFWAYYLFEIWLKYLSYVGIKVTSKGRWRYVCDVTIVLAFLALQVLAVCLFARATHGGLSIAVQGVVLAIVVPFLVWNWLMAFIIYNHHTSASARFFKKRSEWSFYEAQVKGTVHVVFPRAIGVLLNEIMEHTVHHIDVNIPYYRLAAAQRFLQRHLGSDLIVEKWSFSAFAWTLRRCQVYDYEQHRWLTFAEALAS